MSKESRLYNFEVTPPPTIWSRISVELDESELGLKFPSRLKHWQAPPPVQAWQKIAAFLDGSSFVNDYAKRLERMEVSPPPSAWSKIQAGLEIPAVTAKDKGKLVPWMRYAAAAAILGFLAWGGLQLLNNNKNEQDPVVVKKDVVNPVISPNIPEQPVVTDSIAVQEELARIEDERNEKALEESKRTFAKLDVSIPSKIKNAADFFFAPDVDEPGSRGISRGIAPFEPEDLHALNIANRYVLLMTPEGNFIRMSKKLGDLICCVSGEIEEKDCVDQMKKWREKIAYTPSGHSPGNFMEVLNLVNSLQDNE